MNKGLIALPYRFPYLDFFRLSCSPHFPSASGIWVPVNKHFSHSGASIIYTNRAEQTALAAFAAIWSPATTFLQLVIKYINTCASECELDAFPLATDRHA